MAKLWYKGNNRVQIRVVKPAGIPGSGRRRPVANHGDFVSMEHLVAQLLMQRSQMPASGAPRGPGRMPNPYAQASDGAMDRQARLEHELAAIPQPSTPFADAADSLAAPVPWQALAAQLSRRPGSR